MTDQASLHLPKTTQDLLPHAVCVRHGGLYVAGALAGTGLLFAWQASLLDFGGIGLPGPGFFPLVLGVVLTAFSAVIAAERWREPAENETVELGHRDVLICLAAMLGVPILFESAGAYVALGLFGAVLLVFIGRISVPLASVSAVMAMAACWYFFQELLGLQLPLGPF
jgi:hypothetical protein